MKSKRIHYKIRQHNKIKTARFLSKEKSGSKVLGSRGSKVLISRKSPIKPDGDTPIKKPKNR